MERAERFYSRFRVETEEHAVQDVIDLLLNSSVFIYMQVSLGKEIHRCLADSDISITVERSCHGHSLINILASIPGA